jgi:hypothetical protein
MVFLCFIIEFLKNTPNYKILAIRILVKILYLNIIQNACQLPQPKKRHAATSKIKLRHIILQATFSESGSVL